MFNIISIYYSITTILQVISTNYLTKKIMSLLFYYFTSFLINLSLFTSYKKKVII